MARIGRTPAPADPGQPTFEQTWSITVAYPRFLRIRQQFDRTRVEDVEGTVRSQLERLDLSRTIRPGQTVALTAGSRGIANIPLVLRAAVAHLRRLGAS